MTDSTGLSKSNSMQRRSTIPSRLYSCEDDRMKVQLVKSSEATPLKIEVKRGSVKSTAITNHCLQDNNQQHAYLNMSSATSFDIPQPVRNPLAPNIREQHRNSATVTKNQCSHVRTLTQTSNNNFQTQTQWKENIMSEQMIAICSQRLKDDPMNLKLYSRRLQLYQRAGDFDRAISDSESMLRIEKNNVFALFARGNAKMQKGEIEPAIKDFEAVLILDPDNVNAALQKASCINLKGDYVRAIDEYEDALEKDIEKSSILNLSMNLKRSFFRSGGKGGHQRTISDCLDEEELLAQQRENQENDFTKYLRSEKKSLSHLRSQSSSDDPYKLAEAARLSRKVSPFKNIAKSEQSSPVTLKQGKIKLATTTASSCESNYSEEQRNEMANWYFTQGYQARQKNDFRKAIELYSAAVSLKPDFLKAVLNRGFLFDKLGEVQRACEDYSRVIRIDKNCSFAYFNRGTSLDKLGRLKDALSDFDSAIKLDGKNPDFFLNRGNVLQKLQSHDKAIADYSKCLDLGSSKTAAVLIQRALSFEKVKGEMERAKQDYQRALDLNTLQKHICFSRLANIFALQDNLQFALTLYDKAIKENPESLYCFAKRAQLYMRLDLHKLASEDLTKAILINDQIASLYLYRGKAFSLMGKTLESTEDLLRALSFKPLEQTILAAISSNLIELGEFDDAIKYLEVEISEGGVSDERAFKRSICMIRLKRFAEAAEDLEFILEEYPNDLKVLRNLSACLLRQKKYEKAERVLSKIIELTKFEESSTLDDVIKFRNQCILMIKQKKRKLLQ